MTTERYCCKELDSNGLQMTLTCHPECKNRAAPTVPEGCKHPTDCTSPTQCEGEGYCIVAGKKAAPTVPDSPTPKTLEAIGNLLKDAMDQAVANGANSISMPDEYVEIAAWLCGVKPDAPTVPDEPKEEAYSSQQTFEAALNSYIYTLCTQLAAAETRADQHKRIADLLRADWNKEIDMREKAEAKSRLAQAENIRLHGRVKVLRRMLKDKP